MTNMTYADQFCDWLVEDGYTHCFFVAGGNIMHLLNSARKKFACVPVIHEVAGTIAVEYFNESGNGAKAFVLVTAGPGITNCITGIAGAWLEGRELLVVGGQVKSSDLTSPGIRQRGIQEIDGIALTTSITKVNLQIAAPLRRDRVFNVINAGSSNKPGPVFIEFCLDAQGAPAIDSFSESEATPRDEKPSSIDSDILGQLTDLVLNSTRPVLLLGGGLSRQSARDAMSRLDKLGMPIMTTWNALDRIDSSHPLYWGRPNTWGQRSANVLLQQSDLIIAVGSRLGIQQTGFNWQNFAPLAKVVQIEIDPNELSKGHPKIDLPIQGDASAYLNALISKYANREHPDWSKWREFGDHVRGLLPNNEDANTRDPHYVNPYDFVEKLSENLSSNDVIIPCSSGGAFTTVMQAFQQMTGQKVVTNKALASMGYGLSGAIGAAYANPGQKVILIEGDGGFAQNLQDVGTVKVGNLPIKIFIYENGGYASIRMTQANYFNGAYVGCDRDTGLGLPDWEKLFAAYDIETIVLNPQNLFDHNVIAALNDEEPRAFLVPIDPDQTFFPKITSRVMPGGQMESNPLHLMSPPLTDEVSSDVFRYMKSEKSR